ncbi:PqqD family protein [Mucilaginibacter sp. Mucisp86]|uniref:PqqD family protein n=1 Tax=Mucilaginibacter sp. Mucisp86 TaxID=3243060 RepID=UPI0039B378C2
MKLKNNIATSDNGFIFNPATGDSFSGNEMAAQLLSAMKSNKTEAEIKQDILKRYDVSENQLDRDWDNWMLQLKEANLLEI